MKKHIMRPLAAFAVATFTLASCASSNDNMDTTAMDQTTTSMSETQTMAGDDMQSNMGTDMNNNMSSDNDMDAASMSEATSDDLNYSSMFSDIANTTSYDLIALARTNPNLSTFVSLMEKTGLSQGLQRKDASFTIFAPTNEAFQELTKEQYDYLMDPQHKTQLMKILQAHVLPNKVMSREFNETQRIETSDGEYIPVGTSGTTVGGNVNNIVIGGATVVKKDVEASNGVLHVVDSIIMPENTTIENGIIRR